MKKKKRIARVKRKTRETNITVEINIDGSGKSDSRTSIRFLDHMLDLFAKHGIFDLNVRATGDTDVDLHHTNEDIGIVMGQAFREALDERRGIRRFGSCFVPMDETLSRVRVVLDISGRPSLQFTAPKGVNQYYAYRKYSLHDAREFLRAFSLHAGINMHVDVLKGDDPHHILESIFKAFGRALEEATRIDPRIKGIPSTKGSLDA